jgi:hypothetical protein
MRRKLAIAVLLVLCAAGGCRSTDEYWSMPVSRYAYGEGEIHRILFSPGPRVSSCEEAAALLALYAVILLTPVAVDVALLPVTLPHDVWLSARRRGPASFGR